jgi:Zn-dependent protease with chaperone function
MEGDTMNIDSGFFIHDLDKSALLALKAIPGFTQVLKSFMKVWDERKANIVNMSTNLRISEKQLPKYYEMLPPICDKLGIEIPDFYLKLDVFPNAYTWGDTKPYIVITSGLLETMPDELIPTVIAHECGHIACRHALYTSMGNFILSGAGIASGFFSGLSDIVMFPIELAFWHWMRCSELSADRAAVVYDGSAEKSIETCLRFAGLDKDIAAQANVEAFMEQAVQYKEMMESDKFNKTMEFIMFNDISHPLNAVRAYECNEWQKSESFANIKNYMNSNSSELCEKLPLTNISENYLGKDYLSVKEEFDKAGFTHVELVRKLQTDSKKNSPSEVLDIAINGKTKFEDAAWYSRDSIIEVAYYLPESKEEIADAHPGQIQIPNSSKGYNGKDFNETVNELKELGFTNISAFEQEMKKGLLRKENCITRITINGNDQFGQGDWFDSNATIRITYNIFAK